jgi:hypothetical protein
MDDWNHSKVIYSLIQRPAILREWNAVLARKNRTFIGFGWNPQATGRVEGYPDSNPTLQLQDALEFFTPNDNAALLARTAFELAVTKVGREIPDIAPPVPPKPKDYRVKHKASIQELTKDTESWAQFARSILNDDIFPTSVTNLENGALDDDLSSWLDTSS